MCGGPKQILWVLLLGVKSENLGIKLETNIRWKRQKIILQTWLEGSLDNQSAFSDHNQNDDSGNDGMEI